MLAMQIMHSQVCAFCDTPYQGKPSQGVFNFAAHNAGMTFLALDVGNTRLKWALYDAARPGAEVLAQGAEFLENIDKLAEGAWSAVAQPASMLGCIVAGDAIKRRVESQLEERWDTNERFGPRWVVSSPAEAGVTNGYDHPARLGADRWVAMIGAWRWMQSRLAMGEAAKPLVVVMVGTAVTVEAIDAQGKFLGGFILPGHGIMLKALESGTAGLHVPTGEVTEFPTNTSDALTSGGTYAIAGAVRRMHHHLHQRTGAMPVVVMTGGAGWKMMPSMGMEVELLDSLIFDGLLEIAFARGLAA
jgi:type III pantothenate kinase